LNKIPSDLKVVIDHLGKPNAKTGAGSEWYEDIKVMAAYQNVHCKLSGEKKCFSILLLSAPAYVREGCGGVLVVRCKTIICKIPANISNWTKKQSTERILREEVNFFGGEFLAEHYTGMWGQIAWRFLNFFIEHKNISFSDLNFSL